MAHNHGMNTNSGKPNFTGSAYLLRAGLLLAALALYAACLAHAETPDAGKMQTPASTPCLAVLDRFKNAEPPRPLSTWTPDPNEKLPGEGLARHSMLYVGEGLNTIFVVTGGKVAWSYDTGKGGELDDVWMLSNGNILFSRQDFAAEVTPDKKEAWRMNCPPNTEIHSLQPIGLDKVMIVQNAVPNPHILIINKKTGLTEIDKVVPVENSTLMPRSVAAALPPRAPSCCCSCPARWWNTTRT